MVYYQLPLDYLETFTDKILAVTEDEIRTAFGKHLQPNNLVKIIVGGPEPGTNKNGQEGGEIAIVYALSVALGVVADFNL